jgi:hypothetical protein
MAPELKKIKLILINLDHKRNPAGAYQGQQGF